MTDHPMAWADDGACRGMDPELFHPFQGEAIAPEVRAACDRCGVRTDCLEWALRHERIGFWGGKSERQRRRIRRSMATRIEDLPVLTPTSEDLTA